MKRAQVFFISLLALSLASISAAQVPKWKLDVGEQIKDYSFLQDGKFLFLTNYEYSWLFNAETGDKVYELRVKNFEEKGVHRLIGEKFLIGTDDDLQCYDALTGKLIWKQAYNNVGQDDFTDLDWLGDALVVSYGKDHLGIDLTTGKELWRAKFKYNGDVGEKGGWNFKKLDSQNLLLVLMDDNMMGLFQFADGKQVFSGRDYEINGGLLKKGRRYFYASPNQRFLVFLLDDAMAVVDAAEKKELKRIPMKYDNDFEPILETPHGCAVLGKENIVFVNDSTGAIAEVKADVGDFRTYKVVKVGNTDIFFAGIEDAMFAIDLTAGKVLWQSKEKDPTFEGYAHHYIKMDGDNLILTYTRGSGYSDDGTNVHVMSINAFTGKVNYRTPAIFNSRLYIPTWQRSAAKFLMTTIAGKENPFGYENIGFRYTTDEYQGNLVFGLVSKYLLRNPDTKEEPGDGVVIVDPKTGQILFKDYIHVSDYSSSPPKISEMAPLIVGDRMFLIGDEDIAAYDLSAKKRIWYSEKLLKGIPCEAMAVDGVLYVKFGKHKFNVNLQPPKGLFSSLGISVNSDYDEDPYGFAAYDANTGKQLWRVETKVDPGFLTPGFSLANNYDSTGKRLYFADEENIYALQMRGDGGKYDYVVNLDKNNIGEMPFKKTYAIQEWPIGKRVSATEYGYGYKETTSWNKFGGAGFDKFISDVEEADATCSYKGWGATIWGATAKKTLRAVYVDSYIFAIGSGAIALLNASDGKAIWTHKWDYNPGDLQYVPKIFNDKIVYCLDRQLTCVDLAKGETLWQNKEAKQPLFFNSPNEKFLYVIDEEQIRGYELEKQK